VVAPLQLYFSWKLAVQEMQVRDFLSESSVLLFLLPVNVSLDSMPTYSCRKEVLIVQVWRFVTTFCYFGSLSLDLAIHLFFM
jgi:Derlin-2/3